MQTDRASWIKDKKEINIAILAAIPRNGIGAKTDGCEYIPICHVYCSRSDAQQCTKYQKYIDLIREKIEDDAKIPHGYGREDVLCLA